nr:MAG TPA: hypothetical protein [Caudoviricetes sp.]
MGRPKGCGSFFFFSFKRFPFTTFTNTESTYPSCCCKT